MKNNKRDMKRFEKTKKAVGFYSGKFRQKLSAAGIVLIMVFVIAGGINTSVKEAWAITCWPTIFGDWNLIFTGLLNRMIENTLVAQAKSLLAKELNLEYKVGSMMTSMTNDLTSGNVTGSELTAALDFDKTTITPALNISAGKEKNYVNHNLKFRTFKDELNADLNIFFENTLKRYLNLSSNSGPDLDGIIRDRKNVFENIKKQYKRLLESEQITNIYKPYVVGLHDAMYAQVDLNASYCAEMASLGSKQDINDYVNSTNKGNAQQSVNECDKEATKGIKVVIDTSGEALKFIMAFGSDVDGETMIYGFKGKHEKMLLELLDSMQFRKPRNYRYNCIGSGGHPSDGSQADGSQTQPGGPGDCNNIVTLVNTEAVAYTAKFVADVQSDLLALSSEGNAVLMTKLLKQVQESKETVATVINAEKGVDIKIQTEWKDKLTDIEKSLGQGGEANWETLVRGNVKLSDTKTVTTLMAGTEVPDRQTKDSVRSFIVAEEAMKVAANIKGRLKNISVEAIDAGMDDQAWKDYARLTYYNLILENELLKLKAAYAMTYTGRNSGPGTGAEINRQ